VQDEHQLDRRKAARQAGRPAFRRGPGGETGWPAVARAHDRRGHCPGRQHAGRHCRRGRRHGTSDRGTGGRGTGGRGRAAQRAGLPGDDRADRLRHPAHHRRRLRLARVRLRVRPGQRRPVHDGRRLRDGRGAAVPLLRCRRNLRSDSRRHAQRWTGTRVRPGSTRLPPTRLATRSTRTSWPSRMSPTRRPGGATPRSAGSHSRRRAFRSWTVPGRPARGARTGTRPRPASSARPSCRC